LCFNDNANECVLIFRAKIEPSSGGFTQVPCDARGSRDEALRDLAIVFDLGEGFDDSSVRGAR
jgi:hypothetical protein